MTPDERTQQLCSELSGYYQDDHLEFGSVLENITAAIILAFNDALEEVAVELQKLEEGVYTSAPTPAGLVRAMKVK